MATIAIPFQILSFPKMIRRVVLPEAGVPIYRVHRQRSTTAPGTHPGDSGHWSAKCLTTCHAKDSTQITDDQIVYPSKAAQKCQGVPHKGEIQTTDSYTAIASTPKEGNKSNQWLHDDHLYEKELNQTWHQPRMNYAQHPLDEVCCASCERRFTNPFIIIASGSPSSNLSSTNHTS